MIYNTFEMHQEGFLPGAHLVTYIQGVFGGNGH